MSIIADDLAVMLEDTAITSAVSFGVQFCRGIFRSHDVPGMDHAGGMVLSSQLALTIKADALSGLAEDSTITIDGASYRVRQLQHIGPRGLLLRVIVV